MATHQDTHAALAHGRIQVDFTMMDVLGHLVIWLLLSLITLGIALFFWPYAAAKFVINNITIYDNANRRVGKLKCDLSAGTQIGHIVLWLLLTIITLGLAYPFYIFGIIRTALNNTEIT